MSRWVVPALVAAAALAVCAAPALSDTPRSPARLLVAADEWSMVLSRSSVAAGRAIVQYQNRGEDPHDLRIRRMGGATAQQLAGVGETQPRQLRALRVRLSPGRYRLWCSLPGHRAKGMRAVLAVRRAR